MDDAKARGLLSLHRAGEDAPEDARWQEALRQVENDPELARWWKEERELDRIIAAKVATAVAPADLKAKLTSSPPLEFRRVRSNWSRAIWAAAAAIVILAVLFSSWRGPFEPAVSLADYRNEMVSFIKVPPSLELESSDMSRLKKFLGQAEAPVEFSLPKSLQAYEPIGCRLLRFRGRDVTLVCFKIGGGQLAHLFVINAKAMPGDGTVSAPAFHPEDDWMTASWTEGGHIYLLAVKGDRAAAEKFVGNS